MAEQKYLKSAGAHVEAFSDPTSALMEVVARADEILPPKAGKAPAFIM